MKHTLGPWAIDDEEIYGDKGDVLVCRIPYETNPTGLLTETDKANARLIAAAPELLEALQGMLEWARRVKVRNPGMEVATATSVIAKIEGGQQ